MLTVFGMGVPNILDLLKSNKLEFKFSDKIKSPSTLKPIPIISETDVPESTIEGNYESSLFRSEKFKFIVPNPAFENMTSRDGYWGAKIVMSFTDEQIKAAVSSAEYSDPDAADFLTRTIIERRDIIGHYWFSKVNPLDKFIVSVDSSEASFIVFSDLAIDGGLIHGEDSFYQIVIGNPDGTRYTEDVLENKTYLKLPMFTSDNLSAEDTGNILVEIRTKRGSSGLWSKKVLVYLSYNSDSGKYELLGIMRET